MNTMFLTVLAIAGSLFFISQPNSKSVLSQQEFVDLPDSAKTTDPIDVSHNSAKKSAWEESAIDWLIKAQSPNGGWGAGSHAYQNIQDPHQVQTDPATTAFAAKALLKAGGPLKTNPYKEQIMKGLDRILKDIDTRPNNGRITSLDGTQPQIKLGVNIDASMALQFISDIREQLENKELETKVDKAAEVCIELIQGSQNANGGWAGGGWAPVLQSAMANNALERAQGLYDVDIKAIENSRKYQAENMSGDDVRSEDAAGVPLYAAASAQRATSTEAREAETYFEPGTASDFSNGKMKEEEISKVLESKGMDKSKADRLANSYAVNYTSSKVLQSDEIWEGFGNNGGEEYLSYMLTSESLAQQGKEPWLKWRQSIDPKFKQSQNPNGSWSGHHCITSPVFCTAAILQAMNAM